MHHTFLFGKIILVSTFMGLCISHEETLFDYPSFSHLPRNCAVQSCSVVKNDDFAFYSKKCDCDETCVRYGTCCMDSEYMTSNRSIQTLFKSEQCSPVYDGFFSAYMVSTCHSRWRRGPFVRTQCEQTKIAKSDPLAMVPVTSLVSNITYKNHFCSLCNFDNKEAVLWNIMFSMPSSLFRNNSIGSEKEKENIINNLEYNAIENYWGVWQRSSDGVWNFVSVTISVEIPPSMKSAVKVCDSNLESRCALSWKDRNMKILCQSYNLPIGFSVDGNFIMFRNPHCAICNYINDFEKASCLQVGGFGGGFPSYTLLLDINTSTGYKVGTTRRCAENEVYDPFFKKCRDWKM